MATHLISLKCPKCEGILDIDEEKKTTFCPYCGTKILIENESEFIYRTVNEADVKRAETERAKHEKELELLAKEQEFQQKQKMTVIIVSCILGVIGALCFGFGFACFGTDVGLGLEVGGAVCISMAMMLPIFTLVKRDND